MSEIPMYPNESQGDCPACGVHPDDVTKTMADAQALADVRTLDEWAACEVACAERFEWTTSKMIPASKGWRCVLRGITLRPVRDFQDTTPEGARAKAAEWVRKNALTSGEGLK